MSAPSTGQQHTSSEGPELKFPQELVNAKEKFFLQQPNNADNVDSGRTYTDYAGFRTWFELYRLEHTSDASVQELQKALDEYDTNTSAKLTAMRDELEARNVSAVTVLSETLKERIKQWAEWVGVGRNEKTIMLNPDINFYVNRWNEVIGDLANMYERSSNRNGATYARSFLYTLPPSQVGNNTTGGNGSFNIGTLSGVRVPTTVRARRHMNTEPCKFPGCNKNGTPFLSENEVTNLRNALDSISSNMKNLLNKEIVCKQHAHVRARFLFVNVFAENRNVYHPGSPAAVTRIKDILFGKYTDLRRDDQLDRAMAKYRGALNKLRRLDGQNAGNRDGGGVDNDGKGAKLINRLKTNEYKAAIKLACMVEWNNGVFGHDTLLNIQRGLPNPEFSPEAKQTQTYPCHIQYECKFELTDLAFARTYSAEMFKDNGAYLAGFSFWQSGSIFPTIYMLPRVRIPGREMKKAGPMLLEISSVRKDALRNNDRFNDMFRNMGIIGSDKKYVVNLWIRFDKFIPLETDEKGHTLSFPGGGMPHIDFFAPTRWLPTEDVRRFEETLKLSGLQERACRDAMSQQIASEWYSILAAEGRIAVKSPHPFHPHYILRFPPPRGRFFDPTEGVCRMSRANQRAIFDRVQHASWQRDWRACLTMLPAKPPMYGCKLIQEAKLKQEEAKLEENRITEGTKKRKAGAQDLPSSKSQNTGGGLARDKSVQVSQPQTYAAKPFQHQTYAA